MKLLLALALVVFTGCEQHGPASMKRKGLGALKDTVRVNHNPVPEPAPAQRKWFVKRGPFMAFHCANDGSIMVILNQDARGDELFSHPRNSMSIPRKNLDDFVAVLLAADDSVRLGADRTRP